MARIGSAAEADVAKVGLSSVVLVESAQQLAETAGRYGSRGELRAADRLAMAYAQGDADRALERSAADRLPLPRWWLVMAYSGGGIALAGAYTIRRRWGVPVFRCTSECAQILAVAHRCQVGRISHDAKSFTTDRAISPGRPLETKSAMARVLSGSWLHDGRRPYPCH